MPHTGSRLHLVHVQVLSAVIKDVGAANVVAVCTDNASACRAAGALVEENTWVRMSPALHAPHPLQSVPHPHLQMPCAAHVLDLLLEDIGKEEWAAKTVADCRAVVTFVRNHQAAVLDAYAHRWAHTNCYAPCSRWPCTVT